MVEAHYKACLYAGINISGINGEVMPGQWEYQVGPCVGVESGDQMIISRYLMQRVCEHVEAAITEARVVLNYNASKNRWKGVVHEFYKDDDKPAECIRLRADAPVLPANIV